MRPIDEIATEICTLAGHINAAHHRWLMLIAEFDRRDGWSDSATQSCAHWLNWKCGMAMGAAREKVRVARALENLPKISAAMACGRLSYSKARESRRESGSRVSPLPGGRGIVNGGETKPSNLVSLCRFHHRALHEGGIRIEKLDDGALRFVKPNGKAIDSVVPGFTQPLGDWTQLPVGHATSSWKGDRMDHGLAIEVLLQPGFSRRSRECQP